MILSLHVQLKTITYVHSVARKMFSFSGSSMEAMTGDPAGMFWINKLLRCLKIVSSVKHLRLNQQVFYQMLSGNILSSGSFLLPFLNSSLK